MKAEREYVFEVDLPGLKPDEIKLRVNGDGISITGKRVLRPQDGQRVRRERPLGTFVRQLPLPPDALGEVRTTFGDGVLELRIPRACSNNQTGQAHAVAHQPEKAAP